MRLHEWADPQYSCLPWKFLKCSTFYSTRSQLNLLCLFWKWGEKWNRMITITSHDLSHNCNLPSLCVTWLTHTHSSTHSIDPSRLIILMVSLSVVSRTNTRSFSSHYHSLVDTKCEWKRHYLRVHIWLELSSDCRAFSFCLWSSSQFSFINPIHNAVAIRIVEASGGNTI